MNDWTVPFGSKIFDHETYITYETYILCNLKKKKKKKKEKQLSTQHRNHNYSQEEQDEVILHTELLVESSVNNIDTHRSIIALSLSRGIGLV